MKLMPPLMLKFAETDNYFDDHFIAVLECLANLIPALVRFEFSPFAETVFCHCLQVINDTLLNCLNYQEHPTEYDPSDKEPIGVAQDVLDSMSLGLKTHFVKYVQNSNLVFLLYTTMQDSLNLIRQTAIALYGELVSLCYPYLASNVSEYIPIIIKDIDEHTDGVCNNAAWAQISNHISQRNCPPYLFAPLIKIIIEEIRKACKEDPLAFGFNPQERAYEPLRLMQAVMAKTNEVCLRYQDNSVLCSLPQPQNTCFVVTAHAMRNRRKKMEDRHVVIHDLSTMFNIQEASPSSYYAVFDGHAGHDAAAYSSAHLHQYLAENKHFASDPQQALLDAFCKTDALFLEKCKIENFGSGTTAVVALLRPKEKSLYIAWAGDSLAYLVHQGRILTCVNPHKPSREDERARIHTAGGACMMWAGVWRVSGQLAVSRAIGDAPYKPFVTAVPDVREITLDGGEDFLILACDGLWDYISEDAVAQEVYYLLAENSDDTDRISKHLVQLARYQGSTDNISVIVVFLREPSKIAADAPRWATRPANKMDVDMDPPPHGIQLDNQFANSNGATNDILLQKQQNNDNLLLNLVDNISKSNGTDFNGSLMDTNAKSPTSNGTHPEYHHDDFHDDDFGPETDVDTVDEAKSPVEKTKSFQDEFLGNSALENAKAIHDAILGNSNPFDSQYNPFLQDHEKAELETDTEIQALERQQSQGSEDGQREETPTPPIESVQESAEVDEINQDSDSEDEWVFNKGDEAKKGAVASQPETVVECAEEDAMSGLNPNAAEFVPVSPTRSIPSPTCRSLINDHVISQSPKKPQQIDLDLPNEIDFDNEVKNRPSDIGAQNGHLNDSVSTKLFQEKEDLDTTPPKDPMEAFLNGKNVEEIPEFQPSSVDSSPTKPQASDEFHFGPNAAPYTPKLLDQSEAASSTRAVFGDESTATLDMTQFSESQDFHMANKENADPMNMSFSEERNLNFGFEEEPEIFWDIDMGFKNLKEIDNQKSELSFLMEEEWGDSNPFSNQEDLNKVHVLPDNLDEFLKNELEENKENIHDFTISDLPEHFPLSQIADNDQAIKTTDLDQEDEKELASPLEPELQQDLEPSKTPQPTQENLLGDFGGDNFENREPLPDLLGEPKIEAEEVTKEEMSLDLLQQTQNHIENKEVLTPTHEDQPPITPELCLNPEQPVELHKVEEESEVYDILQNYGKSLEDLVGPITPQDYLTLHAEVPINDVFTSEPAAKSPDFELLDDKSPIIESRSPACEYRAESNELVCEFRAPSSDPVCELTSESIEPVCEFRPTSAELKSPVQEENIEVLQEEVTSSVKDDASSPVSPVKSPEQFDELSNDLSQNLVIDECHFEAVSPQPASEVHDLLDTQPQSYPLPDLTQAEVPVPTPVDFKSEPLIPNDQIHNFLDQAQDRFENHMQEINEQIEQIHIKTDNIVPEFAQPEMITPSEESKCLDVESQDIAPVAALSEPAVQDLICPLVQKESTGPVEAEKPKEEPKEIKKEVVKEEAKKSTTKKPLSKPAPGKTAPAASKTAPKPSGATPKTSGVSPRVPAKTGTSSATKPPAPKAPAPTASTRLGVAAPKPKTSPVPKPTASKPLLNGDVKTSATRTTAAKKTSESTLSKPTPRAPLPKTSPTPKPAPISRPTTAPKAPTGPTAAPRTGSTTARPASGVAKTGSTTAAKPKPTASTTRTTTTSSTVKSSLSSTATSKVASTISKTATSPKSSTTAPPRPKTISSAPKLTARVPLTKTITKNAELEKQNKESANKLTASRSTTVTSTRTASVPSTKTSSTTLKKTETKPLSHRTTVTKTTTTTTKSTLGKKPQEVKSTTAKTKTTKIEKPKENGISATSVTEAIMVNNVVNETVNNIVNNVDNLGAVNNDSLVNGTDSDLLKDNSPIDNKLIDNLIEVVGSD